MTGSSTTAGYHERQDAMTELELLRQHKAAIASIRKTQADAARLAREHVCPGCHRRMRRRDYPALHVYSCTRCGFARQVGGK